MPREALRSGYESQFMSTLRLPATTRRHTNVLMHMAGHLKKQLDPESKAELVATIDEYRRGLVPLVVPLTLLRHHVRVHEVSLSVGADLSRTASARADAAESGVTVSGASRSLPPKGGSHEISHVAAAYTHFRWPSMTRGFPDKLPVLESLLCMAPPLLNRRGGLGMRRWGLTAAVVVLATIFSGRQHSFRDLPAARSGRTR